MALKNDKRFWAGGAACALLFAVLLLVRTDLVSLGEAPRSADGWPSAASLENHENWMIIRQEGRRIGTSHSRIHPLDDGYRISETVRMRLNTMGLVQDLALNSDGWLNADLTLERFTFTMQSGLFTFAARGRVEDGQLICRIRTGDDEQNLRMPLEGPLYLPAAVLPALVRGDAVRGRKHAFAVFDPATTAQETVTVTFEGRDIITLGQGALEARKALLHFKGVTQEVWLDDAGRILMEKGLLGIQQERVSREEALAGEPVTSGGDLTRLAAVVPDRELPQPAALPQLTLRFSGVDLERYGLSGGRQRLAGDRLHIVRESLLDLPQRLQSEALPKAAAAALLPSAFIQSDHADIRALAERLTDPSETPLVNLRRLISWMQSNIERRPVLSVPNALSTLQNRMGDCNEHAMLLAALARAAGYPAQVEAGLVYHEGRFYYHAWNRIYLGRWITADALFNQIPADVSHIRFARGSAREQLDILPLLGNLQIKVIGKQKQ